MSGRGFKLLHIIRKPNSIIVLLFIQNISRSLRKTKLTALLSSVRTVAKLKTDAINFGANFNSTVRNLKINGISIFVTFSVFLLSLSFNSYLIQLFKPTVSNFRALWLGRTKPLLRDVSRPIIFLLLDDALLTTDVNSASNNFSVFGRLTSIVQ